MHKRPKATLGKSPSNHDRVAPTQPMSKILQGILAVGLVAMYAFAFLRLPISDGFVTEEGQPISRGGFVFSSFFLPDEIVSTWYDDGRLPAGMLGDRCPLAVATLAWIGLATVWGLGVTGKVGHKNWSSRLESLSKEGLIGLALLSSVTMMVGWLVGLTTARLACAIVLAIAATWLFRRSLNSRASIASSPQPERNPNMEIAPAISHGIFDRCLEMATKALVCLAGCMTMLGAWVPAVEFDVLEYHLQAPKEFFQRGSIGFLPHNIYANMPLGAEMHSLAMMTLVGQNDAWLGGMMGKSIIACISLLGAVLLGTVVAQRWGTMAGWVASGLWLTTPGIAHVAMLGLVDGALATYVLASAIALSQAHQAWRNQASVRTEWLVTGIMAGAAASIKYPGLVFGVAPVGAAMICLFFRRSTRRSNERLACGLAMLLGLAVTCGPWYAKNWMLAGNPVYPLAASIFGGLTLTDAKIAQWQKAHRIPPPPDLHTSGLWGQVTARVGQLFNDALRILLSSPYVQPSMVVGVAIAFGLAAAHRRMRFSLFGGWLLWSLWIVGVWWLATHRIDRFWLPLTGFWAGSSAVGLLWLRSRISPWLAHATILLGLCYGCLCNSTRIISDNRFFVSLESLRSDIGLKKAWINEHLSQPETLLLAIGDASVFQYTPRLLYSTCFDTNPGEAILRDRTSDQQRSALKENGITHILVDWTEIGRYRSPGNYGFSEWPQTEDVQRMIDAGIVSRVDWDFPTESAELLKVNP